jgi:predicted AlkP superfamily phosphohydrolase/phosphomutase
LGLFIRGYFEFEEVKRLAVRGILFSGAIGSLWAVLYWRNDIEFAIAIILIYILCGFILSLSIIGLANILGLKINPTGLLGLLLGAFWVSPILLFGIDAHYTDLAFSIEGLLMIFIAVFVVSLIGLLFGCLLDRSSRIVRLLFGIFFCLIVPVYFALMFPERSKSHASNITIVNRLDMELKKTEPQTRVMVFGIDGGTWDVIIPLLKQGKLPNLRALMENGQYGILHSDAGSTYSPVVWTSIFTGKLPKNHGVTEWEFSDSRNRFSKSLWNILNEYGQKAITVNIPGTFPPEKILGIQISGFPIPEGIQGQGYGRIYSTENRNLKIVPTSRITMKPEEGWFSTPTSYSPPYESHIPSFVKVNKLRKLRYGVYSITLSNLFLEFLDRRGVFESQGQYSMLIIDTTDDGTVNYDTLYVFTRKNDSKPVAVLKEGEWSDWIRSVVDGIETRFRLKLLTLSKDRFEIYATPLFQSSFSPKIPFTYPPDFASKLSKEIGQYVVEGAGWVMYKDEITLDLLYEHLHDVATQHVRASEYLLKTVPDWALFVHLFTESDRIQHPYWRYFQPQYYKSVDGRLVRRHGEKINSTMEKIDAHIGRLLSHLNGDATIVVVSDHGFQAKPDESENGEHSPEGIYVFSGKGIKNHHRPLSLDVKSFPKASLMDISPTILYLMGYPVGRDMDGKVILNVIDGKELECCQVKFVDSYESGSLKKGKAKQIIDESTKDQLRSLGYMK